MSGLEQYSAELAFILHPRIHFMQAEGLIGAEGRNR